MTDPSTTELVSAIAHEVGNHLGGIRMQAHLLDDELDARGLAEASVLLDGLAGRSAPLLALLRPLLEEKSRVAAPIGWHALLDGVRRQLEDDGTRGIQIDVEVEAEGELEAPPVDWIHSLLIALVGATLDGRHAGQIGGAGGRVVLRLQGVDESPIVSILDDADDPEDLSVEAALRGRPLAIAIARALLARVGGHVESRREADWTVVDLRFPRT